MLQPDALPGSWASEAVLLTDRRGLLAPTLSVTTKYVVEAARAMPRVVNAWTTPVSSEAGFERVPRLAPGAPLLFEWMLTVNVLALSELDSMLISTLVSV